MIDIFTLLWCGIILGYGVFLYSNEDHTPNIFTPIIFLVGIIAIILYNG
jgi:hypothetical protein